MNFSPDRKTMRVSLIGDERDWIVDLGGKQCLYRTAQRVSAVSDGGEIVASMSNRLPAVKLIEAGSNSPKTTLWLSGNLSGVAFPPYARTLAAFCEDSFIYLWSLKTDQEVTRLRGPFGEFAKIQFSANGRKLATITFSDGNAGHGRHSTHGQRVHLGWNRS
jgi:WD40 repeat protein